LKIHLKEVAKKSGMSLYKLAHIMGLPQQTIYSWANGRTQPNYGNMDALCQVLKCTMSDLFTPEDATRVIMEYRSRTLASINYKYNKFDHPIE